MIRHNIAYASITAGLKLISGFFLLVVIARIISVSEFGIFMYALSFSTLFGLFVDYGYQIKLLKDIPGNIGNLPYMVSKALFAKIVIFIITMPILLFSAWVLSITAKELSLIIILSLGYAAGSFANTILISYKCTNKYNIESMYVFIDTLVVVLLVMLAAFSVADSTDIASAYFISKLIYLSLVLVRYIRDYGIEKVSFKDSMVDLKIGIPFAIHYIVGNLYLNVDTLILKEFVKLDEVAIYQAGLRLVVGAGIVLTILNSVLTPRFADYLINDRERLYRETYLILNALLVVGSMGVFLAFQYHNEIAIIIYGSKYSALGELLPIFAVIIFLRVLGAIYGILLTIGGSQRSRAIAVLATLVLVVALDFIFVPIFGIVGAVYVLLIAHIVLMFIYLINVKKVYSVFFITKLI